MPGLASPLQAILRDLLVGAFSRRRPAGTLRRKPWAIRNVRDEDKMPAVEVIK